MAGEENPNWQELKRHRNRVNSQKTRNRERDQIDQLQNQKTCLYLANTALQFQNQHIREAIQQVRNHVAGNTNLPVPAPPHSGIAGTQQQSILLQPPRAIPTPPMVAPPQNPVLQQQIVQQVVQQILTNSAALQPQVSLAPAGNGGQQVALALQNELATSPMLSSALNAGLLQWSLPNSTRQETHVPSPMPTSLQNATLASLQLTLNQLATNSATNIQGAQLTDGQQRQSNEHLGNP